MQAVILAGGEGTRMGKTNMPKALIKIGGIPILQQQLEFLNRQGIKEVILCVKYMSEKIMDHFGDGRKFGVSIKYSEEDEFLGTAGAVKLAEKMIKEDFILLYCDVMLNMDLKKLLIYHKSKGGKATLVVHESDHLHDSDVVDIDKNSRIRKFWRPKSGEKTRGLANAAVHVLSRSVLEYIDEDRKSDFGKDIFPKLISINIPVYGYVTKEYIKDIGTPERLKKVISDYESGKIFRPAVFLDRDGVINEEVDLVCKPEQLKLLKGSADAVRMLNENGFLTIIITNQPVVARNLCTEDDVVKINEKLEELLSEKGASIDKIYYCPHHPDKGHLEENPKYKIDCECRKPKPGMIFMASNDFGLNPRICFLIGDRTADIKAGESAGCKTILVKTGFGGNDNKYDARPDYICENLMEAAKLIIKTKKVYD